MTTVRLDTLPVELLMNVAVYLDRADLLSLNLVNAAVSAGSGRCLWSSLALHTDRHLVSVERSLPRETTSTKMAAVRGPPPPGRHRDNLCHVTALDMDCTAFQTRRLLRVLRALGTQLLSLRLGLVPNDAEVSAQTPTGAEAEAVAAPPPTEGTAWRSLAEGDRATVEAVSAACANLRELEIRGPSRAPNEVDLIQAICKRAPFLRRLYLDNVSISTDNVLSIVKTYPPGQLTGLGLRPVPFLEGWDSAEASGPAFAPQHRDNQELVSELRASLADGLRYFALVGCGAAFLDLLVGTAATDAVHLRSGSAGSNTGTLLGPDTTTGGAVVEPGLPLLRHLSIGLFHPNEVEFLAEIASRGCLSGVTELTLRGMPTWGDGQVHLSRLLSSLPQLRRINLPALRSGSGHILSAIMPHLRGLESLVIGGPIRSNPSLSNLGAASAISGSASSRTLAFVEFESAGTGDEMVVAALVRGCPNLTCVAVDYTSWPLTTSSLCSPLPTVIRSVIPELGGHRPTPAHGRAPPPLLPPCGTRVPDPAAAEPWGAAVPSARRSSSPMASSPPSSTHGGPPPPHSCSHFVSIFANPGHDGTGYQISGRERLERAREYGEEVERAAVREREEHIAKINSEHRRKNSRQRSGSGSPGP